MTPEEISEAMEKFRKTIEGLKIEIASKKYCENHASMIDKTQQTFTNTEVIKTRLEEQKDKLELSVRNIAEYIKENVFFREMTLRHDEAIKDFKGVKALVITTLIAVIAGWLGIAVTWGEIRRQVTINTARLDKVENNIFFNK